MAKHEVACVMCGKMFDAEQGGSYDPKSRRYTCPKCIELKEEQEKLEIEYKAEQERLSLARKKKRNYYLKIIFAIIFIISAFIQENIVTGIFSGLIGLGLGCWALVPHYINKKNKKL